MGRWKNFGHAISLDEAKEKKGSESVLQIETASFVSLAGGNEINDERSLFLLGLDEGPERLGELVWGFSNVCGLVGKGNGTGGKKGFYNVSPLWVFAGWEG